MQDDSLEASTSISQLLRESYLAETRHRGNNERSRAEPSSNPFHFGTASGAAEGGGGQEDLPDLSAFLSQEELDESVNLARLAINHDPLEKTDEAQARKRLSSDQMKHSPKPSFDPNFCHDNSRSLASSKESPQEAKRPQYSSETQSKKVFLNKAADFIEELSSLFKAHSSKRIRPRACKNHKSKLESQNKVMQENSSSFSNLSERRERSVPIPIPADTRDNEVNHALEQQEAKRREAEQAASEAAGGDTTPGSSPSSLYYEEPLGQPPRFTQKLRSREVPEGTRVQLDCIVVGIPPPQVRWYCEGKELENSPDIHIIQAGNLHSLTIAEAFEEDTGRYSCFASNIYGTDSTSAEIYIEGVSSSDSEGDPNKEEMNRIQKPKEVSSLSATSTAIPLAVPQTQPVMVQPSVSTIQQCQSPTNYLQGLDGKPIIAAPVFTKMLQNLSATEGQLVVFECRVKGAPSPKVEWYREGTLIEDSPDFRILQKKPRSMAEPEEICTLVIAEVFAEDSGCFTCTASNKYGTVSSIAQLDVRGNEDLSNNGSLHSANSTTNLAIIEQQPSPPNLVPPTVEQPPKPKLEGVLVNHNEPRSSSRIGLRVHFNLPEDDKASEASSEGGAVTTNQIRPDSFQERVNGQAAKTPEPSSPIKEPPPVLAKPKLDSSQLQQLHNQVLLEQQQLQNPSPSSPKEFPFNMSVLNSTAPQVVTVSSKQVKAPASQTFSLTRPKHFFPSTNTTLATASPSSSPPAVTLSSTPQAIQRTVSKENLLISQSSVQTKSPGGVSVQNEPPPPSPIEPTQPPLTFSISSGNHFQPHCVSPTPVSPTSRIQNPVAFLSSVLPSLPAIPPTNAMGLPRSAPSMPSQGLMKKNTKSPQPVSDDYIRETKNAVILELGKKVNFSDVRSNQQEYKISNFEQRLMNEIEFRLERTPVDESDDEIQHDEIPTGKCIAPIFDKRLKHFRVTEGSPVTFTCKIVGIPVPKVYWFKDGKQISKRNGRCKMSREGDRTCSLHIESTTSDDDGNYTIMAANPQGRISCSGHLMVQSLPIRSRLTADSQSHRGRSRVQERDKEPLQERFFRPHFLQAPGDMVAHEGRLCRLDCKVSGLPPPELTWLLNGQPVLPDASHKMLIRETGVHSLLIDPLTQRDAGTYTCVATNKTGQNSFSLELTVVAKEVKKAPVILEKLQNCGVPEGHPVRLECRVIGMPPPVFFWKKDNETIPFTRGRISMHQDTTGYVCLLIQPAKKSDAGWYTLSAKNEVGIVSCTARLDIYGSVMAPSPIVTCHLIHFPAQWHQQIPPPMSIRPTGSRYGSLTTKGLDIFSAFSSIESTMVFSCSSRSVVESDEL
ncbi:Myopalladin [Galemys pyrenaicus]|uniref:Myopalladin n=1 Tax=Galemys pyrenaicus TaxID=202257 RepID=A0A8J6DGP1_GALPY|nr:Myopalladin [Galemys pyrenaicus]